MAKKAKKMIKPKKKGNKSNNIITRIIIIIFVLILALGLIFSVFKPSFKTQKGEVQTTQAVENQQNNSIKPADNSKPQEEIKAEPKEESKIEVKEDKTDNKPNKKEEKKAAETKTVEQSITGRWMSTTGGAFLTMGDNKYKIDFMGVDIGKPIQGTYTVSGDIITFVNKEDPCKDVIGVYEVKFDKHEIGFKCKSDECTKRHATLPTEWEWLDTDE